MTVKMRMRAYVHTIEKRETDSVREAVYVGRGFICTP